MKRALIIAIPTVLLGCLGAGALKSRNDPYALLRPYLVEESVTYSQMPTPGHVWSDHLMRLKGVSPREIELLIQRADDREKLSWNYEFTRVTYGGRTTRTVPIGRFAIVKGDNVTVYGQDYLNDLAVDVDVSHHLAGWEVLWLRLTHIGKDPFQ